MEKPATIAIDGPASSGKSTLGCLLADELGYLYFDTGVMYRAVTLAAIHRGISITNEGEVGKLAHQVRIDVHPPSLDDGRDYDVFLDGVDVTWDIRQEVVDANVSEVSAYRAVRDAMTTQQRRIAMENKVVMVGRDIGTVVMPEADLKIYLDAPVEVRACRRYKEILERGEQADYHAVLNALTKRDDIDSNRDIAPLVMAKDAVVIHTECLGIHQVLEKAKELVNNV